MTRYLITGAHGMLGHDMKRALAGREFTALGRRDLDITNLDAVMNVTRDHDVIINAAAYTKVDEAESHEDEAHQINAIGARNLARAAAATSAPLVQISTDYVFNGRATSPYNEYAPHDPISAYGRTKAAGETLALAENPDATFVVRTAWLYGANGGNFAATMLALAKKHETLTVVDDQWGQPTWTLDLADKIVELLDAGAQAGIYHGTSSGETTWYEFARTVFLNAGLDPDRIRPVSSAEFVRPAPRPSYSVLGHDAWKSAGLSPIRDWRSAYRDYSAHSAH